VPPEAAARRRYLELMKRALCNYLYLGGAEPFARYRTLAARRYHQFRWRIPEDSRPHTLLGRRKLDRLERIVVDCLERGVPGDLIEAGVWNGGAAIFMRAVLAAYGDRSRRVWLADTFAGIPASRRPAGDPVDAWPDRWVAPLARVRQAFARYGLLDRQVRFLRGDFARTLHRAPLRRLALVRLDADSYESTRAALEALYPRISPGGYLYVDDWHLPGCRAAVLEYRRAHGIVEPIDRSLNAMWQVGAGAPVSGTSRSAPGGRAAPRRGSPSAASGSRPRRARGG
jgi:hypothetical protein